MPNPTPKELVARLLELREKATPGPWTVTDESALTPREPYWIGSEHPEVGRCTFANVRSGCDEADELGDMLANAELIALAPAMVTLIEQQAAEIEALTKRADDHAERENHWRNKYGEVMDALGELVSKLDEIEPHMADAFFHREMRCGPYEGPQYGEELRKARALVGEVVRNG